MPVRPRMLERTPTEAQDGREATIQDRVAARLGVLPNFFCTAASAPGLIDRLWDFARSAYFDNPLPSLFKERLFVHLSRFCEVRYCIVRHVGFLLGLGFPAGDRDCPPQSLDQVMGMLKRPVPNEAEFAQAMQRLGAEPFTSEVPAVGTRREADLFDALTLIFLEPRQSGPVRQAVARALGEANLELLTAFLAFVRTAHFWTETHPELEFEPDMLALMRDQTELEQLLLNQAEAERTWSPMERARLLATLAAREAQKTLLLQLVQAQRETDDPERIEAVAAEAVGRYLDVGVAAFATIGKDGRIDQGGCWTAEGMTPPGLAAGCEAALRLGVALSVTDTATEMPGSALAAAGLLALLSIPLKRDGVVTGALLVGHASIRRWSDDEIALVREVATRTRDAVERTQAAAALREEQRTLATLNEVGTVLAAELDLGRVVQMVTDAGVDLTGAQFGAFFYNVLDPKGGSYTLYTLSGVDRAEFDKFPMPRNTAVFAPTFGGQGVVRSDDILADHRYGRNAPHQGMPTGHLPVRSYLAISVVSRSGEVLGGLFFGHPETGRFLPRHERLMVAVAAQAAIAIDNARLFKTAQHELEERRSAEARLQDLNDTLEERIATATAERAKVEERLRQSQKMEAVGQLTGGLAHDFNNLLTGISGSLELLQARVAQGRLSEVDRYVTVAQGAAARAAGLTHRLLAFSRRQTLDPKPTDVNRLVAGLQDLIERTMGPLVTLEVVTGIGTWPTLVDAGQLENALLNLSINARDAMPDGGRLTIETANRWLDEHGARERELTPGQYVSLCVSDSGTGMTPEVIARAFDPFFTTKPIGSGTGLGLSMVYGFARQSGGQVRIYSEPGQGTNVCVYLPRHLGEGMEAEQPAAFSGVEAAEQGQTVLVVDDEPPIRMLVTEVLGDLGYTALEAEDGPAGLQILRSSARIDLLVTDVGLPGGMNGRQVADAARVLRPNLKVLFITGYAENAVLSHGHLEPGMHVLTKPFAMKGLASRIKELIVAK